MGNIQYPHSLYKKESSGDSYQDTNGNWVTPEQKEVFVGYCNAVHNNGNVQKTLPDGRIVRPSFSIYMDNRSGASFQNNQSIRIVRDEDTYNLTILYWRKEAFHTIVYAV